ncbi:MAG: hypothetical protein KDI98_06915 [Hyphomicrobiaceae bacterium]|nr:hypothetical protein [Hyphomicrobiaceae bacterium]
MSGDSATVIALRTPRLFLTTRPSMDFFDLVAEKADALANGAHGAAVASIRSAGHADAPTRILRAAIHPAATRVRGNRERLLKDRGGSGV